MNEELNVYNLPENKLYQFSTKGEYIFKVKRNSTRVGNFATAEPRVFTEVYLLTESGELRCMWSGSLVHDDSKYGKNSKYGENVFGIFDHDMDNLANFEINMPLEEAPAELYDILDIRLENQR